MPSPHFAQRDPDAPEFCTACPLPVANRVHLQPEADDTGTILGAPDRPAAPVGVRHPATAKAAAARALPRSGTIKARIFSVIALRHQGATDDELEQALQRSHQSVSAARNALMNDGLICPRLSGGEIVTRPTRTGNEATVWAPSPAAAAMMGA